MRRVVLPSAASAAIPVSGPIYLVVGAGIVVVWVGGEVFATPAASATPTASSPRGADRHANAERNRASSGNISGRRIVGRVGIVRGRAPGHHRVIGRHVNDVRTAG